MDTRIKYIDVGGIYAKNGEWVTCENGHFIAMFSRTVKCGDAFDEAFLELWRQPVPEIGDPIPVCKFCGGDFVRSGGCEWHLQNGWRTVTPAKPTATGWFKKLWQGLTSR